MSAAVCTWTTASRIVATDSGDADSLNSGSASPVTIPKYELDLPR